MWIYSNKAFEKPLKWGGKLYNVKQGVNELPTDVGKAFFMHIGNELPPELEAQCKGKPSEVREMIFDEYITSYLASVLRQHGRNAKKESDVDWLKQFICADTREELESLIPKEAK
jgi:hypothetical protein